MIDARRAGILTVPARCPSLGWMVVTNFLIASDFKWLLAAFLLPWAIALLLWLRADRDPLSR